MIGGKPIHTQSDEQKKSKTKLKELFIDTGLQGDRVKEIVRDGSVVTRMGELMELGDCLTGKSLDNRISVFILIEALKKLRHVIRISMPCLQFRKKLEFAVHGWQHNKFSP